ncbi:MAG: amidohydrolase [Erysipelotrichaceae bacterium]|nr:amidohydrolase [Erysipelotrichaceae bacterium]
MICIRNGLVFDAVHEQPQIVDVLMDNGKIIKMGELLEVPLECEIVDAEGLSVYPGLVDAHSHLGTSGSGIGFEGNDTNEMTDILTPHLRAIDCIEPMDISFKEAREGGVTTVCTGPGSANVVGGTFIAIKTVGKRVDDMVINDKVAMKCAFGENPKRCYRDKNNASRMATASKLREILFRTKEYDAKLKAAGENGKKPGFDMKLDAMLPVIRKEIPLKAHAHRADDIFTALRIAKEFDVNITLEHVTDGSLIVDDLVKENIMLAVGPSFGHRSKFELKNKSFKTAGDLANAGCHVSIITDAPVIPQQYLRLCAGLAIKDGMKPFDALKAITINAAEHAGVSERVGSLEVGKDADIILVDGSLFESQSKVVATYIDGKRVA